MTPGQLTRHRAIAMATRLAITGKVPRARAVVALMPPGPVVIEVNETVPIARRPRATLVPTTRIPYLPLEDEATAWIAEYRAARGTP